MIYEEFKDEMEALGFSEKYKYCLVRDEVITAQINDVDVHFDEIAYSSPTLHFSNGGKMSGAFNLKPVKKIELFDEWLIRFI